MENSTKVNSKQQKTTSQRIKRILKPKSQKDQSSNVLVSAVISPYLLTHLHQILQRSELKAKQDGRLSHATNFAKLRKVLCLDARSMEDASAQEITDSGNDFCLNKNHEHFVA